MKLSQSFNDALNQQILIELGNQNKYMQLQSYFESLQLKNLASYFKKQADGEKDHANLFMDHVNNRNGGKVVLGEVISPMVEFLSLEHVSDYYVAIERDTTESIEDLYELAFYEKSYIDLPFLNSMLSEQVEEEDISLKFAMNLRMVKDIVLFDATFEA
jgi:ferritin